MNTPSNELPHVSAVDPVSARQYLINVAETLHNVVVPELQGKPLARTRECVTALARVAARLTAPNAAALSHLKKLRTAVAADAARTDGAVLDAEEEEFGAVYRSLTPAANTGQRSFDAERMQSFLRAHPFGSPQLRITEATPLPGGRSKLTVLIQQEGSTRLPERFILRQDWAGAVTGTSVAPEFEILRKVYAAGVKVPEPILLESSAEALGAPFLLVKCVEGHSEGDLFEPPASESLALEVAAQLGQLHALSAAPFAGLLGVQQRAYTPDQLRAELESWRPVIARYGEPCVTMDLALDWLDRNLARVEGPQVLVHGDLGFHNFLVHEGKLAALLDWEIAHLGNPAQDLGYVRSWTEKMIAWDKFLAAYAAAGGPRVNEHAVNFYTLWGGGWLYFLLLQARAAIVSGALRDCEIMLCSAHYLPCLLHRMSRELRRILARS